MEVNQTGAGNMPAPKIGSQKASHNLKGIQKMATLNAWKTPALLVEWLEDRDMNPDEMSANELYSAALELQYDIENDGLWANDPPAKKAAVTKYIRHMGKFCKRLPLWKWY